MFRQFNQFHSLIHLCWWLFLLTRPSSLASMALGMPDCLNELKQCDATPCKIDLHVFYATCGVNSTALSMISCFRENCEHCRAAIFSLKMKWPKFQSCGCDSSPLRTTRDYYRCSELWLRLTSHPCLTDNMPTCVKDKGKVSSFPNVKVDLPQPGQLVPLVNKTRLETPQQPSEDGKTQQDGKTTSGTTSIRVLLNDLGLRQLTQENLFKTTYGISCSRQLEKCLQINSCKAAMKQFQEDCSFSRCESQRERCMLAYERYRLFGMFNCDCHGISDSIERGKCVLYQAEYIDNKCLALINTKTNFEIDPLTKNDMKVDESRSVVGEDGTGSTHIKSENCMSVYQQCIRDSSCLKNYLWLRHDCRWDWNTDSCNNYPLCSSALKSFYSTSRPLVSAALHCTCPDINHEQSSAEHQECRRHREIFQPLCAQRDSTVERNCLSLMQHCVASVTCLDTFLIYNEVCMSTKSQESMSPQSPQSHLINSFHPSQCTYSPIKCNDLHRALLGSLLSLNCSCEFRDIDSMLLPMNSFTSMNQRRSRAVQLCRHIHRTLHSPLCQAQINPVQMMDLEFSNPCTSFPNGRHQPQRIPSPSHVSSYHRLQVSADGCAYICLCPSSPDSFKWNTHCQRITCSPLAYSPLHSTTSESSFPTEPKSLLTEISFHKPCEPISLAPSEDPEVTRCRCHEGEWLCQVITSSSSSSSSSKNQSVTPTEYFLKVDYNMQRQIAILEFHMKQQKLWNDTSPDNSIMSHPSIHSLHQHLADALTNVIHGSTGLQHCRLLLLRSSIKSNKHSAQSRETMNRRHPIPSQETTITTKPLYYNLFIEWPSEYPPHTARDKLDSQRTMMIKECVNALHLLQVMISGAYPEVRYNVPLSILTDAKLYRPEEGILASQLRQPPPQSTTIVIEQDINNSATGIHIKSIEEVKLLWFIIFVFFSTFLFHTTHGVFI